MTTLKRQVTRLEARATALALEREARRQAVDEMLRRAEKEYPARWAAHLAELGRILALPDAELESYVAAHPHDPDPADQTEAGHMFNAIVGNDELRKRHAQTPHRKA